VAEYEVKSKERVDPFAPIKIGHVEITFRKENEKEKKIIFYKKPKSSLSFFRKFQQLSFLPPRCFSSLFFSTIVASLEAPNSSSLLPQIARKSYFRSLGASLYFVGL